MNSKMFFLNIALFFTAVLGWVTFDLLFEKNTDVIVIYICAFFVVWNVNVCVTA